MSVFHEDRLPPLTAAKAHSYYLLQSPQDQVTPYSHAEKAQERLGQAGARITLASYEGGHGWTGDAFGAIREGLAWLEGKQ